MPACPAYEQLDLGGWHPPDRRAGTRDAPSASR